WGGQSSRLTYRLLASAPFVAVGRASYSFYLWHFPIFAYAAYLLNRSLDPLTGCGLAAIALALSFATLRWVEDPVRRSRKPVAGLAPVTLLPAAVAVGLMFVVTTGLPNRLPQAAQVI